MDLQTAARAYLDVPFHHQGRNKAGMDCGGLLVLSSHDIGVILEDLQGYARQPDGITMQAELDRQLNRVHRQPQANDVLLMRFRKHPQHIAIKTDNGIIHAFEKAGKVVEHTLDKKWRSRIVGVYTYG